MRVLVTGGGTGGHVYPALSVVDVLLADPRWATERSDVAWVGSAGSIEERIIAQEGLEFHPVATGALRGGNPFAAVRNLARMARGYRQAQALLDRGPAPVVLATGGYVSVPLVLAARRKGCPVLIYLPDVIPGLAIRWLSRFADRVAVSFASVVALLPKGKAVVTGYPVRRGLQAMDRRQARQTLGLEGGAPVLLILGGSSGAHSINEAVRQALPELLGLAQVVHISGFADYQGLQAVREALSEDQQGRYHVFAYLYDRMSEALAAADLVVARAGAATLGEFPAVGLPSILVPYPHAGPNQEVNARYLVDHGAAEMVLDRELEERLLPSVRLLLGDRDRLARMAEAARTLAVPDAAEAIAALLRDLAAPGRDARAEVVT